MEKDVDKLIKEQKERLFSSLTVPPIAKACTVGDGIIAISEPQRSHFIAIFTSKNPSMSFFIPASGSGSRMFDFLQQFLGSMGHEQADDVKLFLSKLSSFAFYHQVAAPWKERLSTGDVDLLTFCDYLLGAKGLDFSGTPKALFPFHEIQGSTATPLEGHIRQAKAFAYCLSLMHFTVQREHEQRIKERLNGIAPSVPFQFEVSIQAPESDSFVFDEFQRVMTNPNGDFLKRPSGHGALLSNLNRIDTELILIKNIDNIQHPKSDAQVQGIWELLCGVYLEIVERLKGIYLQKDREALLELNAIYQLFDSQIETISWATLEPLLLRPLRVCGMVPNEGMSGGGPFWVHGEKLNSKQIIEKSQLGTSQLSKLSESTHFNPVMMVLSPYNIEGQRLDLNEFVREDTAMAVKKNHFGNDVFYLEKPGLWNGSMFDWNSVFVEIPSSVFSPVKNVMDLLKPPHRI
jgi:hypothetical protein